MKKLGKLIGTKQALGKSAALLLAAVALLLTGCPHNEYLVQLKPQGDRIERTLVFYCADGVNTNTGLPNYQKFGAAEMAAITALYPAAGLTNDGDRHVARGEFTNQLPADVGGAGTYVQLTTLLGETTFYVERFRGNDDLAGMAERRLQAADRLTDLLVGWSEKELGREPAYGPLRQFLNVDFRRDLKNFATYWWEGQLVSGYKTNADEEFGVRFGQYLLERGYFSVGEMPGLFIETMDNDPKALLHRIQRLAAGKMGVRKTEPVPASLAFLADEATMEKSFDQYLAGTVLYRAKLKQWEADKKLKPDAKEPEPSSVASEAAADLIEFDLFGHSDHLAVRLSLAAPPVRSNGRWDEALRQVVWETDIESKTNATHVPFTCYANWVRADEDYQTKHFGKTAVTGDQLTQYCLWHRSLETERGVEWDAFLSGLQPGADLLDKLAAFHFAGETVQTGTNIEQKVSSPSDYPRELLKTALR